MRTFTIKNRGFTLIELLIVLAIFGILSAGVSLSLQNMRMKARDMQRKSDLAQIQLSLRVYKDMHGSYPRYDGGVVIGDGGPLDALLTPYFNVVPRDALARVNGEYTYYYDSKVMCANGSEKYSTVLFALKMENPQSANWEEVCEKPGAGTPTDNGVGVGSGYGNDNANEGSYAIIIHEYSP